MSIVLTRRKNKFGLTRELRVYTALEISRGEPVGFFIVIRDPKRKSIRQFGCFASIDEALNQTEHIRPLRSGKAGKKRFGSVTGRLIGIVEKL